jgi:L-ascorbate metabolism protein UlaG (beta-lactamase superfamily)
MRWCQGAVVVSLAMLWAGGLRGAKAVEPEAGVVDFHSDRRIDLRDFSVLARNWRGAEPAVDVAPPEGDGIINFADLSVLAGYWLAEVPPPVTITWLGHASVRIACEDTVVYVDPQRLTDAPHDATWILVTHSHSDHYAPADIAKVKGAATRFVGPADVVQAYGSGTVLLPGQVLEVEGLRLTGVASYNLTKTNHPKSMNWLGFIVELGARRVYVAGDTDLTPEMKALTDIDVAFLPAGGTYTMDATEAAEATKYIKPILAIPYHWGQVVGTRADAERFVKLAACNAKVMTIGETLSSNEWRQDFSFVAHWRLDEAQGDVAGDSVGAYDGGLVGGPVWQPAGGRVNGAILLDGVDDVVATPFVLNPSGGAFSIFAWVKGGAPGQVILSQKTGLNWLMAAPADGALMTELRQAGRSGKSLACSIIVTDGTWHRVGLVWDGSNRMLYVDNVEVAGDTQTGLQDSTTGLLLGAGSELTPGTFWSGLIDDVRLYTRAVKP